jgi:hypothetical protein
LTVSVRLFPFSPAPFRHFRLLVSVVFACPLSSFSPARFRCFHLPPMVIFA